MSLRLPRPRRRTGTFRPRFETLEQRWVPSCTTTFSGSTLTITGDNSANTIVVNDNGANTPTFSGSTTPPTPGATADPGTTLAVSVTCNGTTTTFPATGSPAGTTLTTVLINLGTKKSSVTYNLTAGLRQNATRNITANLGKKGNDTFALKIGATVVPNAAFPSSPTILSGLGQGSTLGLTVNSGKGNETITVDAFQDFFIAANASATINLKGSSGNDNISTNLSGDLRGPFIFGPTGTPTPAAAGKLTLTEDGGSGNNNVYGFLNLTGGTITASVKASKGTESLGLVENFNDTDQVFATPGFQNPTHFTGSITGSGAKSSCFRTPNVTVTKCKQDFIV